VRPGADASSRTPSLKRQDPDGERLVREDQFQGVARPSLRSTSRAAAAIEAQALHQAIVREGWNAAARFRDRSPSSRHAPSAPTQPLAARLDVRYWKPRLLRRRYAGVRNEFSVSIEHAGASHYLPLGTADDEAAAARALEIYRTVVRKGWSETFAKFPREVTVGLHWAAEPLAWTYATFQTVPVDWRDPDRDWRPHPALVGRSARTLEVVVVEGEPGVYRALAALLRRPALSLRYFADARQALAEIPQKRADLVR
jgi:hypothetical protein